MKRIIYCLAIMVALLSMLVASCAKAPSAPAPAAHKKVEVLCGSGPFGEVNYAAGFALEDLLKKHNHPWLTVKAIEAAAGEKQAVFLSQPELRDHYIAFLSSFSVWQMEQGLVPGQKAPYLNVRYIAGFNVNSTFWNTFDKNIKTPADFAGKSIAQGSRGGVLDLPSRWLFEEYGVLDKVRISHMKWGEIKDALVDGTAAAGLTYFTDVGEGKWRTISYTQELLALPKPIYFVSVDPAIVRKVAGKHDAPVAPVQVPAGAVGPKQPNPVDGYSSDMAWEVDAAMDEEVAYELAKFLYEHVEEWWTYHAALKGATKQRIVDVAVSEKKFHPGALRYYKEKGLKVGP